LMPWTCCERYWQRSWQQMQIWLSLCP